VSSYIRLSYFHLFQQCFIHIDIFYPFFIHFSSNLPTLYNVEKIVWPTVYAVFCVVVGSFEHPMFSNECRLLECCILCQILKVEFGVECTVMIFEVFFPCSLTITHIVVGNLAPLYKLW
jgi:hypothetical protein